MVVGLKQSRAGQGRVSGEQGAGGWGGVWIGGGRGRRCSDPSLPPGLPEPGRSNVLHHCLPRKRPEL